MVSINSMGAYVPKFRVSSEEFEEAWGSFSARGVEEKAICAPDEDTVTMAIESTLNSLDSSDLEGEDIDALMLASTSLPYEERSLAPVIATAIGASESTLVSSFTDSTRVGTEALISGIEMIRSGKCESVLVSATDFPKAKPDDDLEHGLGAGSCSFVLSEEGPLEIEGTATYQREYVTSRFRRRPKDEIEKVEVTGMERQGFVEATTGSAQNIMDELDLETEDIDVVAIQQMNCRRPYRTSRSLGLSSEKLDCAIIANKLGDVGAASPFLSFAKAVKEVERGDRILMISFGSGDVSDAISIKKKESVKPDILKPFLEEEYKESVSYANYLKLREDIITEGEE